MSEALKKQMREAIVSGLRRRTLTTCSRWAMACVVMPKPYAGPINFKHHPWLLEMHDSDAPVNTGQKAAQMGFTVAAMNRTFFKIDVERVNCLYLLPTKTPDATDFTATRFNPLLELSPHLSKLFNDVDSVATKRAGSACLYIRGSNSRSSLKSIPVAFIVFDEYDEMNQDNLPMAQERMSGQVSTQQWRISTPTAPDFGINQLFQESTQEHFFFPCPLCSRSTELIWPDSFVICGNGITDPDIKKSHIICKECKKPLAHEEKIAFLRNAKWEPTGHKDFDHRGFYMNQMYSSTVSPPKIAEHYFRSLSSGSEEQEFYNQKMGLPHVVAGGRVSDDLIDAAKGTYSAQNSRVRNVTLVTMGVDVGKWLHCEIAGWNFASLCNDINVMARPDILLETKVSSFEELDKLMYDWQVRMCVIDANPERRKAYEFAMRFFGAVKLCYYGKGITGKLINVDQERTAHKITVDRTSWLDMSLGRFHNKTITLPYDVSFEYREHMKAPTRIYKEDQNGNPIGIYVNSKPDHFAHARNYNEIALPLAASLVSNSDVKCFL